MVVLYGERMIAVGTSGRIKEGVLSQSRSICVKWDQWDMK